MGLAISMDLSTGWGYSRDPVFGEFRHPYTSSGLRKVFSITRRVTVDDRATGVRVGLDVTVGIVGRSGERGGRVFYKGASAKK